MQAFVTVMVAAMAFGEERALFVRESQTGTYAASAYFIAKSTLELPIQIVYVRSACTDQSAESNRSLIWMGVSCVVIVVCRLPLIFGVLCYSMVGLNPEPYATRSYHISYILPLTDLI